MSQMNLRNIAELISVTAIVVSLIFLIIEVRENSLAIEQQSAIARADAITQPFFESNLASVLEKISVVDGAVGMAPQFAEKYKLTLQEAILWERHLWYVWEVAEATYITEGASEKLQKQIQMMLLSPDHSLYVKNALKYQFNHEFRDYVIKLQQNQAAFLKSLNNYQ